MSDDGTALGAALQVAEIEGDKFSQKPIERRLEALDKLLNFERSTSKAMAYSEWDLKPNVVYI